MKARLDSRALGLFVAVAESLSFRQAAQTLHMSQPPLSRAIRELEERLGTRLFERDTRAVSLTEAGRGLLPRARQILRLLGEAESALAADAQATVLRLGLTSAVEPAWFAGLSERIAALRPQLSVHTVSASSPKLIRQMREQRLHAAFIALPTEADGLDVVEIERYAMCIALPAAHRLARKRRLRLSDLDGEALFWFERARQPAFFDLSQRVFARHGFAPRTVHEPLDHHVLLAEVAAGRGLGMVPDSFRSLRRRGVVYRPLLEGDELSVGIGLALSPGQPDMRKLLLSMARSAS